ncbi:biotin--[acetyl-CoA-carboxylase] ligase [Thiomicrorhabdus aquaedulcis]|uniref:biotin--[acetyl-CoA-carboxylase] ligase n=1 Tax=Thiomicrorhabdus aquaedulcis TaxID=2211106 RepID=UPI000FD7F522|nr:biotin--[acetyl-CoA-carboxylase] ligase [Thiomicrorhabdus aquaedulcis]
MLNISLLRTLFCTELPMVEFTGFEELKSTNGYLKNKVKSLDNSCLKPHFCITNHQTAGYGQRNKNWLSNSECLTFSVLLKVPVNLVDLDGLPLILGLTLIEGLSDRFEQDLFIKWPNDLYTTKGKFGGLLIEVVSYKPNYCWLIIGVGLNLSNNLELSGDSLAAPIDFLKSEVEFNLEILLVKLVERLINSCDNYSKNTFSQMHALYTKYDFFKLDQDVIVYDNQGFFKGKYKGLSATGAVRILQENKIITFRSGSVSIRPLEYYG